MREWEQARLDALTADIFGFNAMQIGLPQINALQANRMPNKWLTDTHFPNPDLHGNRAPIVVLHDFAELPFASQSLDLVVLPHVLEFAEEPHQVLREVERVLIPEGQVIICGFNPASLWGARQVLGRITGSPFMPRHGEFISLPRLKDWLKLLSMEVNRGHFGCYSPPCATEKWLRRFSVDELPQLFNVVTGDMSLIGPRPQVPAEVAMYSGHMDRRLRVRPGMTGLWQVSGRSSLTVDEAIRLDLYYVDNWSMLQDLNILAKTFGAVFGSRGAY